MASGRDDFVIAFRSAFLKKKDKQKFSLLTLLFLSIFVIILSNFNFKIINAIKLGINEIVYRSSYLASIPENKIKEANTQINNHKKLQMIEIGDIKWFTLSESLKKIRSYNKEKKNIMREADQIIENIENMESMDLI